ncbi:MAG: YbhB/YbcL family Raf kinase inhibitor-like protein [FCB group bacterium]|nr:YbhB/YbcL family Raf kinase inhibitor-like protein [FCB group bacterium]
MKISSPAFQNNGKIPPVYTCDDADYSPPLQWSGIPENTQSLALIADDPDAPMGTWVHWVIYNIPAESNGLSENFSREPELPNGTLQGKSDFGKIGYGGPCPPGGTHRYFFKLYALDILIPPTPGLTKRTLLDAMEGHILDQAVLMGTYRRE